MPVARDFKLDLANGVLARDARGGFALAYDVDAVRQAVFIASGIQLAEWFFDVTKGFPWRELVFVKDPDLSRIRTELTAYLLAVPGVVSLDLSLAFDRSARRLDVTFTAASDLGAFAGTLAVPFPEAT